MYALGVLWRMITIWSSSASRLAPLIRVGTTVAGGGGGPGGTYL